MGWANSSVGIPEQALLLFSFSKQILLGLNKQTEVHCRNIFQVAIMNDLSSDMQETEAIDYNFWFNKYFGNTGTSEEPASLFDMCYLHPVSGPDSSSQEVAYQVQQEKRSEYDFRYWLSEYDSCCDSYWGNDLFSGRYSENDGCNDPTVETMEDSQQSADQDQSFANYYDYKPWSCHQNCEDDHDSYCRNGEIPRTAYGYLMDEVGLCEGIFGYFPCMQKEYINMPVMNQ